MSLVSVIIPTFNRANLILRALDSVLSQSFRDFDIRIIDDGGSDDTESLVHQRAAEFSDVEIHYKHTPNRGVAAARNFGIGISSGRWIALLDSDDEWLPDKLEKQLAFLRKNPEISLIHSGEMWIRNGVRVNAPKSYQKYGGDVFEKSLPVCMIGPSTAMFSRDLFESVGGFDENFPVCEDYDFWLRATSLYETGFIDEPLTVKYGGHEDQLSKAHVAMDYWRIRSMCRILSIRSLTPERRKAILHEIDRKGQILLKGYKKHGRYKEYQEVLGLIESIN